MAIHPARTHRAFDQRPAVLRASNGSPHSIGANGRDRTISGAAHSISTSC